MAKCQINLSSKVHNFNKHIILPWMEIIQNYGNYKLKHVVVIVYCTMIIVFNRKQVVV